MNFIKVPLTILVVILMLHIKKIIFSLILKIDMSVVEHRYLIRIIQIPFIGGMKGLQLPFLDLDGNSTISDVYSTSTEDDFYDMTLH